MDEILLPPQIENKIKLWALRVIEKFGMPDSFFQRYDDILQKGESIAKAKVRLKKRLAELEKSKITGIETLDRNLDALCAVLNLSEVDKKIIEFAVIVNEFAVLGEVFRPLGNMHIIAFYEVLGYIIGVPAAHVKEALRPESKLRQSNILEMHDRQDIRLDCVFRFFYIYFSTDMLNSQGDILEVFRSTFFKAGKPSLKFDDFRHIKVDEAAIKNHILKAGKGVNILLYGLPGTGKTEFVKMIAAELDRNLYEIASKSRYTDDNYNGEKRFLSLKTADKVLNKERDIIMFDEIEDVFKSTERMSKALFNSTLEGNGVPTFWITNDIDEIDNAYIRRFDMVIEFKIPPKFKRLEILKRYTNGQVSEELLKKLAKSRAITPALISGATKVISNLSCENKDETFKNLIKSSLKAQGFVIAKKKGKKNKKEEINLPQNYDVSLINANVNLKELAKGIKESKNARLCLYGPAGTGKSEYAKFIAKSLNSKLIIKKASDLIDCYVGNTEKNIANAFKEAKDQNAVLVFDEIDSFLQDRGDAVRKWEITQVNEMLVQMESFDGVFIATTNLMDRLDRASIRRFDMKIEFGYMEGAQAAKLLQKECESLGISVDKAAKNSVAKIKFLTPGDFAAVVRSAKFSPILGVGEFIDRLNEEIKHKIIEDNGHRVGF
nr:ATP-binding protein [uncultured Campylobacter sp.]